MNLDAPARGEESLSKSAYPGLEFLCPPRLAPFSLLWGHFAIHQKGRREAKEIQLISKPTDFTGWFSLGLFSLAYFGAVLGHMRFFNHKAFSRPDFPLE